MQFVSQHSLHGGGINFEFVTANLVSNKVSTRQTAVNNNNNNDENINDF